MSRISQGVISAVIEARKCFERQPERVAYFIYEKDGLGTNDKRIQYVVMKDHPHFGTGFSVYDRAIYLATFDSRTIDLFEVGVAASTAPAKQAT
jgi:hypothetical protein